MRLTRSGWAPRIILRADLASGGNPEDPDTVRTFYPPYPSAGAVSEGLILGDSNLALLTAGIALTPTPTSQIGITLGQARRLSVRDAVYGYRLRPVPGANASPSAEIGTLLRIEGRWSPRPDLTLKAGYERLLPPSDPSGAIDPGPLSISPDYSFIAIQRLY